MRKTEATLRNSNRGNWLQRSWRDEQRGKGRHPGTWRPGGWWRTLGWHLPAHPCCLAARDVTTTAKTKSTLTGARITQEVPQLPGLGTCRDVMLGSPQSSLPSPETTSSCQSLPWNWCLRQKSLYLQPSGFPPVPSMRNTQQKGRQGVEWADYKPQQHWAGQTRAGMELRVSK